jgi:hemolysin activation/secretion protein
MAVFCCCWINSPLCQAGEADPYVVKEYPDGTKVKIRWSEIRKKPDDGQKHGGMPVIRTFTKEDQNLPEEDVPMGTNSKLLKIYPDGTKVTLRWSELDPEPDEGKAFGGPPQIVPYDSGKNSTAAPLQPRPATASAPVQVASGPGVADNPPTRTSSVGNSKSTRVNVEPRPSAEVAETQVNGSGMSGGFPSTFSRSMGPSLQYGQAFQDYGPSALRGDPLPKSIKPNRITSLSSGGDEEITSRLSGIAILGKASEVNPRGLPNIAGLQNSVPGLAVDQASKITAPYFGKKVTMKDLDDICRQIMAYFEDIQQPVVTAVVPEQEIRGGVVQILVVKGQMGKVKVKGNRYFQTENLQEDIQLQPGEDLDLRTLTDNVAWLNSNPFRQVDPSLAPGEQPGQTDVVLEVKDRFPIRPFVSYDNFGIQSLGYNRFSTGASLCDIWTGFDQQLNYQFLSSGDFNSLISNSGAYVAALPWQHNLSIFGTYSKANPAPVNSFTQNGYFWQASMRYNIPLPTLSALEGLDFRHQTYLGYDFKASDTNIFFQGAELPTTSNGLVGLYNISQFVLGYSFNLVDPIGSTSFETVLFGSPGGMTSNNTNTAFQNIDGGADAQYIYGKFSINRLFRLPGDAAILLSGQIQQADSNLMPSESFGIGGYDTVRGYDQRSANGDNAYLGNVEIRTPPISFWQISGEGEAVDQLVLLAFFDYGQVLQYSDDTTTSLNWHLMSVGPGLRYNIGPYFNVRFDWGFQLQQAPAGTTGGVGGPAGTSQAVISASLAY